MQQKRLEDAANSWHFVNEEATLEWAIKGKVERVKLWSILSPTLLLGYHEHGSIMPTQYIKVSDMGSVRIFGDTVLKADIRDGTHLSLRCPDRESRERWFLALNTAVRGCKRDRQDGGSIKRDLRGREPLVRRVLDELEKPYTHRDTAEENYWRAQSESGSPDPPRPRPSLGNLEGRVGGTKAEMEKRDASALPHYTHFRAVASDADGESAEETSQETWQQHARQKAKEVSAVVEAALEETKQDHLRQRLDFEEEQHSREMEERRRAEEERVRASRAQEALMEEDRLRLLEERERQRDLWDEEREREHCLHAEAASRRQLEESVRRDLYGEEIRMASVRRGEEERLQREASERRRRFEGDLSSQRDMLRKHEDQLRKKRDQADRDEKRWEERRKEEEEWLRQQHRRRADQREVLERQKRLDIEEEKRWDSQRLDEKRRREEQLRQKEEEEKRWRVELEEETRRMEERRRFEESVRRDEERKRMEEDLRQQQEEAEAERRKEAERLQTEEARRQAAEEAARRASAMSEQLQHALEKAEALKRGRTCRRESDPSGVGLSSIVGDAGPVAPASTSASVSAAAAAASQQRPLTCGAPHPYLVPIPPAAQGGQQGGQGVQAEQHGSPVGVVGCKQSSMPPAIKLSAPHPFEMVSGVYTLRPEKANGWPCWESEGRGFVYATKHGYWAVVDEAADMENDTGLLQSSVPHYGRPPPSLQWDSACDGKWKKDPRVVVVDAGSGSPPRRASPPPPDRPGLGLSQMLSLNESNIVVCDDPPVQVRQAEGVVTNPDTIRDAFRSSARRQVRGGSPAVYAATPQRGGSQSPRMMFAPEGGRQGHHQHHHFPQHHEGRVSPIAQMQPQMHQQMQQQQPQVQPHSQPQPQPQPSAVTSSMYVPYPTANPRPRASSLPRNESASGASLQMAAARQRRLRGAMRGHYPLLDEMASQPDWGETGVDRATEGSYQQQQQQQQQQQCHLPGGQRYPSPAAVRAVTGDTDSMPSYHPGAAPSQGPCQDSPVWDGGRADWQSKTMSPVYPKGGGGGVAAVRPQTPPMLGPGGGGGGVPGALPLPQGAAPAYGVAPPQQSRSYSPMGAHGAMMTPPGSPRVGARPVTPREQQLQPQQQHQQQQQQQQRGYTTAEENRQRWDSARLSLEQGTVLRRHSVSSGAILERAVYLSPDGQWILWTPVGAPRSSMPNSQTGSLASAAATKVVIGIAPEIRGQPVVRYLASRNIDPLCIFCILGSKSLVLEARSPQECERWANTWNFYLFNTLHRQPEMP